MIDRQIDRTRRHDGGDGVLVYHLRHGVLEEHDVLVEGLDLTLKLDSVDQIDRYRNVLLARVFRNGSCSNCPLLLMIIPDWSY